MEAQQLTLFDETVIDEETIKPCDHRCYAYIWSWKSKEFELQPCTLCDPIELRGGKR